MDHDALMMEFPTEEDARVAADTLDELGYEAHLHEGGRVHIHIRNEDLTSALEIMQSHGGRIVERASGQMMSLADEAYNMDAIPIPAHTVNEDWAENYAKAEMSVPAEDETFPADDAPYDRFDAT